MSKWHATTSKTIIDFSLPIEAKSRENPPFNLHVSLRNKSNLCITHYILTKYDKVGRKTLNYNHRINRDLYVLTRRF